MFSTFDPSIKKPCDNCWITAGEGRIEYEDGTEANIDTGAYLHHMVVASLGAGGGGLKSYSMFIYTEIVT